MEDLTVISDEVALNEEVTPQRSRTTSRRKFRHHCPMCTSCPEQEAIPPSVDCTVPLPDLLADHSSKGCFGLQSGQSFCAKCVQGHFWNLSSAYSTWGTDGYILGVLIACSQKGLLEADVATVLSVAWTERHHGALKIEWVFFMYL